VCSRLVAAHYLVAVKSLVADHIVVGAVAPVAVFAAAVDLEAVVADLNLGTYFINLMFS